MIKILLLILKNLKGNFYLYSKNIPFVLSILIATCASIANALSMSMIVIGLFDHLLSQMFLDDDDLIKTERL